jgi:hypothetical protein
MAISGPGLIARQVRLIPAPRRLPFGGRTASTDRDRNDRGCLRDLSVNGSTLSEPCRGVGVKGRWPGIGRAVPGSLGVPVTRRVATPQTPRPRLRGEGRVKHR